MEVNFEIPPASHGRHIIDDVTRVGDARRDAQRIAALAGLSEAAVGRAAIVVTELSNNLLRHGGGGQLLMHPVKTAAGSCVEFVALDRGRGMNDVGQCMADGYSTTGTAGTGLGAIRRLAVEFDIHSEADLGTIVMARIGDGKPDPRPVGVVSIPIEGEIECGDGWRIAVDGPLMAVMVVDGLGHGCFAAQAAQAALEAFDRAPFDPPSSILERIHRLITGTRGAAGACARIDSRNVVQYAGIGNIRGVLVSADGGRGLVSHNGTLGLRAVKFQQFEYPKGSARLIMHSDGISSRWDLSTHSGLLNRHPAIIAGLLVRDHSRHDDATVLVID
jgi:anti-sigma regulatory factor (Ser/Thr protein kinase)